MSDAAALERPSPGVRAARPEPGELLALPPLRAVLRLATPTTFVMLLATGTNVLYTYFVSRIGAEAIAAVSLVFPFSLLVGTAMTGGLGGGAAAGIARALGGGRRRHAAEIAEHALALAVAVGLGCALLMALAGPTVFRAMGGDGAVLDAAVRFARVVFGGAAITFTGGMLDCVLRGEGNVRVPSLWSSAALAVQVVLTPVCMFALHLGLVGAAVAFVAAQAVAIVPRLRFVLGGRGVVTPRAFPRRVAAAPLLEILRVGVPASLSTIVNYLGLMVLTGVVARLGTAHLAAYGLGTRFDFLLMSVAYGFAAAVLTLTGLATGAGHPERARIYVRLAGLCIVLIVAVPSAALVWDPTLWIGLFSHDPDIVAVGTRYFRTIGPSYPFVGVSMVLAFAFQGLGRATLPLVWMVARVTLVLAASIVCTQRLGLGDQAIFTAMAAGNVVSSLAMATLFVVVERRLRRA